MGKKWTPGPSPPAPSAALTIPSGHLVRTSHHRQVSVMSVFPKGFRRTCPQYLPPPTYMGAT
eukprot:scaffold3794_cov71-Skeletonema_marinoi.AAC.1